MVSEGGAGARTGTATGALAGMILGAAGGPIGLLAGAVIGGVIGSTAAGGREHAEATDDWYADEPRNPGGV